MNEKTSKPKSIRNELEKQYFAKYQTSKTNPLKEKYQGLKLNWKDGVIFSLCLFFTGLYHAQALAKNLLDLNDVHSGMVLSYQKETNNYSSIQLLDSDFQITIQGIVAYTKIKQKFKNNTVKLIEEGMYAFPIEHTAAVYEMQLKIGQRLIKGEIHEKNQAEKIYQQAKSNGLTASLVKQYRPNLFTTKISNILPNEIIEVEITYQQVLIFDNDYFEYRLPLKIKPRYAPQERAPTNNNPTNIPSRKITVDLDSGFELKQLKSLYHPVKIKDDNYTQNISFSDSSFEENHDFVLRWKPYQDSSPKTSLFTETQNGETYALLMMFPPQQTKKSPQRRELIYIVDTSGSMHGKALDQAKDALLFALTQLNSMDSFNIIEFNSHPRKLFPKTMLASPQNINQSINFIDSLISTGGTNMAPALTLAMQDQPQPGHLKQIVFITDGSVGNEAQLFTQIAEEIGEARLFTVSIGAAPNDYFMSKSAQLGRGTYTHVGDLNEVDELMSNLFRKLSHPALTNININWNQTVEQTPRIIPDMYSQQPVFITAKIDNSNVSATVSGQHIQKQWAKGLNFNSNKSSFGIAKLWARQKIDELTDELMLGSNTDLGSLKKEITALALKHNLVSQFTSLVAVDKNPELTRLLAIEALKNNAKKVIATATLPQTSTGWMFQLLAGLVLTTLSITIIRRKV